MHYYSFHINDYRAATAHLSNEEDLAYRRLIDMYYDTEQKIPLDTHWVSRRIRVGIKVVESVLADMFIRTDDGWYHPRCQEEIEHYQQNAQKNRENGRRGGRPKKTQSVSNGIPVATQLEPNQKATINHEIRTIKQEKEKQEKEKETVAAAPVRLITDVDDEQQAKPEKRKRAGPNGEDPNFARFWSAYNYAVGRHKALKSWNAIAPDQDLADQIIAAAELYSSCNPSKTYYKHATTWLNNRHWEDDPNAIKPKIAQHTNGQMSAAERARRAVGLTIFGNLEEDHGRQREIIDITPAPPAGLLGSEDF